MGPDAGDTASLVRNHVVHVSDSNLVTIAGDKWTTYRTLAVDAEDATVEATGLEAGPSITDGLLLEGAHREWWSPAHCSGQNGISRLFNIKGSF